MTPPDPARIAAGLTSDMRALLTSAIQHGQARAVEPSALATLIARKGLMSFTPTGWGFITPLGRAVRAALAAEANGAGQ